MESSIHEEVSISIEISIKQEISDTIEISTSIAGFDDMRTCGTKKVFSEIWFLMLCGHMVIEISIDVENSYWMEISIDVENSS